jgi:hypothetical protein
VSVATVPTECGLSIGEIIATINGGAGGYTANWTGGHVGTHITGLHPGSYNGTISDANNCIENVVAVVGFYGAGDVTITQLQILNVWR